jgi:type I restriction enzyme S subunit
VAPIFGERDASEYSGKTFSAGDTLFARITPCTENGKAALVPEIETEVGIGSTEFAVLSPKRSSINPWFLYYLGKSHPIHNYAVSRMRGSTGRQRVPFDVFRWELDIALPPLEEQRKIATVFYTVDQAIQKTEEIEVQSEHLKRGLMQDLFSEGLAEHDSHSQSRLGEIPAAWDAVKLGGHIELVSGARVKSDYVTSDSSQTPYITGPEDFEERGFTVKRYTDEPTKFCEEGDILVTVKGLGCGKSTIANRRVCISRQLKALRPKREINRDFLFYYIRYKQDLLETFAEGSAIPGLTNSLTSARS